MFGSMIEKTQTSLIGQLCSRPTSSSRCAHKEGHDTTIFILTLHLIFDWMILLWIFMFVKNIELVVGLKEEPYHLTKGCRARACLNEPLLIHPEDGSGLGQLENNSIELFLL